MEVVLEGYWDSRPPANIKAGILADWADALEDWHHEQVVYALRKWRNENPSKKPNPGHILSILKAERGKAEAERAARAEPKQETQKPGPTQEERERMAAYVAAKGFPTKGW